MNHPNRFSLLALMLAAALISACAPQAIPVPTHTPLPQGTLIPFSTTTPSLTAPPIERTTPTPLPSPTPTMRSHTIRRGQDLGGIAFAYRVSLQALMAANPDVNPNLLVVDSTLNIPHSAVVSGQTPVPTPVPVQLSPVHCNRGREGGAWCFALASNRQDYDIESVSAIIRIAGEKVDHVVSQVAVAPLDLLPAGGRIPLVAYFPPRIPDEPLQASIELVTSLPVFPENERYVQVLIEDLAVTISEDGLEAEVSGELIHRENEATDVIARIALVAYDGEGYVVGVRRWDSDAPLPAGSGLPFTSWVYSTGGQILRVDAFAEARRDQR
ncbi:MAG TPA: LysM domain-containing protein [Levilinea sp.]|nr:LysM domain-containing protein [Levilinea sp.]